MKDGFLPLHERIGIAIGECLNGWDDAILSRLARPNSAMSVRSPVFSRTSLQVDCQWHKPHAALRAGLDICVCASLSREPLACAISKSASPRYLAFSGK